jgi:3-dehydroquinate synthase
MDPIIKTILVTLKDKSYNILIGNGILSRIESLTDILSAERFAIIISSRVHELYHDFIGKSFKAYDNFKIKIMNDGEEYKNYKYAESFFDWLLENGYSRRSCIVAIGGGVVGDFAGFVASCYMRGIPIVHIPTTLLAMVDSSIGGKVAVNISVGKNIVGAFYQPEMILSDVSFLRTLPEKELKNGITETVKHALIGEGELLNLLLNNDLESIKECDVIEQVIYLSAKFKSSIVQQDEREDGLRAILNFGHTVGHAIESLLEYRNVSHGEAVAMGLKIEMVISKELGLLGREDILLFDDILKRYDLLYNNYRLSGDDLLNHMRYDKKNVNGNINFVLLKGLGNPVYNRRIDEGIIREALSTLYS